MSRIISESELSVYLSGNEGSARAKGLLRHQWEHFPMAKGFHDALTGVREKRLCVSGTGVRVQFNPARIVSSAAKVDAKSIQERKCFLCEANLPVEQKGLPFGADYIMLCNPFLIFPEHLTVPHLQHTDQRISGRVGDMLALADELSDFVIFYNGPQCGASAPDHFHFQAGNKGFLPLETELQTILSESGIRVLHTSGLDVYRIRPFGANALLMLADDSNALVDCFEKAFAFLSALSPEKPEPMMNVLAWKVEERYCLVLFPRILHRPSQFFAEGEDNILLSPAAVDLGGVFITPLEKDFLKIEAEDIVDILTQITVDDATLTALCDSLSRL